LKQIFYEKKGIKYHLFTKNSKVPMHSIKNVSERNKIDTQSRADAYMRRKRLIKLVRVIII
jgi:hypothetical protein